MQASLTRDSTIGSRSFHTVLSPVLRVPTEPSVARIARVGSESQESGCHGACSGSKGCAACLRSSGEDRASDGVTGQRSLSREWRPPRQWSKIVASCMTRQSRGSRHRETCRRHSPCRGLQAPRQPPWFWDHAADGARVRSLVRRAMVLSAEARERRDA